MAKKSPKPTDLNKLAASIVGDATSGTDDKPIKRVKVGIVMPYVLTGKGQSKPISVAK